LADELGRHLFTPRSVLMFAWIHRTLSAAWLIGLAACAVTALGCGSTRTSNTARTATEQLLISDAIDRTVQQINFKVLEGQTVFFDERHLLEAVDKAYLISSFRQHLLANGCVLKEKREDATYVVEPRVGAVGTDNHDWLVGIPAINVPQVPLAPAMPAAIPEIPFAKRRDQRGVAKLAVFAYRRETGEPVWQSGMAISESEANDIWVLGTGPFKRGTIYEEKSFASGRIAPKVKDEDRLGPRVAHIGDEAVFAGAPRVSSGAKNAGGVIQASAQAPVDPAGPAVLPPPKPISEAPAPPSADDPATTAG
jgi:hypothetical protein